MKGILFKPDMIKAIVEGRKTQTRRLMKLNFGFGWEPPQLGIGDATFKHNLEVMHITGRYQAGEVVYIKEAWCESYFGEPICYKLDGNESPGPKGFWRSPMFLPARAARYFIQITNVRPERLQEITEHDANLEGIGALSMMQPARMMYQRLWDSINKQDWNSNPWVWVYSFKLVSKPEGEK